MPPFYQHVIGPQPLKEAQCQDIAQELELNSLLACSEGSYDLATALCSHAWVFGSGIEMIVATGAGAVDSSNEYLSSYRAELSGLLATLYITYRICQFYDLKSGKITCYCNNKDAIRNSFKPTQPGQEVAFKMTPCPPPPPMDTESG
jgi:hypothetical protein